LRDFFAFEIGFDWVCFGGGSWFLGWKLGLFGFELGLYWVCFSRVHQVSFFHNPLLIHYLRSFDFSRNWVCFA